MSKTFPLQREQVKEKIDCGMGEAGRKKEKDLNEYKIPKKSHMPKELGIFASSTSIQESSGACQGTEISPLH